MIYCPLEDCEVRKQCLLSRAVPVGADAEDAPLDQTTGTAQCPLFVIVTPATLSQRINEANPSDEAG